MRKAELESRVLKWLSDWGRVDVQGAVVDQAIAEAGQKKSELAVAKRALELWDERIRGLQEGTLRTVSFDPASVDAAPNPTRLAQTLTRHRLRAIQADVGALRRRLFGRRMPPFSTWPRALRWIEQQQRAQPRPRTSARAAFARILRDAPRTGLTWEVQATVLTHYGTTRRTATHTTVKRGSPLGLLATACGRLARATFFDEAALLAYVLAGTRPRLSRIPARLEIADLDVGVTGAGTPRDRRAHRAAPWPGGAPRRVVVAFQTPDLTNADLKRLHDVVRHLWGQSKDGLQPRTRVGRPRDVAADDRLLALGERRGGLPESLRDWDELAKLFPGHRSGTSLRFRARRLPEELRRLGRPVPSWLTRTAAVARPTLGGAKEH